MGFHFFISVPEAQGVVLPVTFVVLLVLSALLFAHPAEQEASLPGPSALLYAHPVEQEV